MRLLDHQPRTPNGLAAVPAERGHVLVAGTWADLTAALPHLPADAWLYTLAPGRPSDPHLPPAGGIDLVLVLVRDVLPDPAILPRVPWVVWALASDERVALAAYASGATAVLPAGTDGGALAAVFARLLAAQPRQAIRPDRGSRSRTYRHGSRISIDEDDVLHVVSGVVVQRVLHDDGSVVVTGLSGPGRVLVGHPDDGCCLDLLAHTDVEAVVMPWDAAVVRPRFAAGLRDCVRQMEAWTAAQARPRLVDRLLGVLAVVAEQFGRPHPEGLLIDVRLTHDLLASATASTRATVTRALGTLQRRRSIWTSGLGAGQRVGLSGPRPPHRH